MDNEKWTQWKDCHKSSDQKKRIASAEKAACTPISLDKDTCCGSFKGSSGTHTTTLANCSCIDFNRRRLPCKHMYRLAMELGLFQANFSSDLSAIVEPGEKKEKLYNTVSIIETLTETQQRLLHEAIRSVNSSRPTTCCETTPDLYALINANLLEPVTDVVQCLSNYKKTELKTLADSLGLEPDKKLLKPDLIAYIDECAHDELASHELKYTTVRPCSHIKYGRVNMYLHRKFDTDDYCDAEGIWHHDSLLKSELPDDDVTALLMKFGYYDPN